MRTTALLAAVACLAGTTAPAQNPTPTLKPGAIELLTSYQPEFIKSLMRPDATSPQLLQQLPPPPPPPSPVVKLYAEFGGSMAEHRNRFTTLSVQNSRVEVLDTCASACTMVLIHVAKEKLCFGPAAMLKFHAARMPDGAVATYATEQLYLGYPDDIRAWIDRKGGIPSNGTWLYLDAQELWKMGYRKCSPG